MRSALHDHPAPRARTPNALAALLVPAALVLLSPVALRGAEPLATGAGDGWLAFEATYSAAGQRLALRAGDREAATLHLSGTLVVLRGEGLRRGFRAEAVAYDDGAGTGLGTMVLTDDRGEQLFARLTGTASQKGTLVTGTITGGSGAYAGITGDFSFVWRHFVRTEEGEVQGVAESFKGRYRRAAAQPGARR